MLRFFPFVLLTPQEQCFVRKCNQNLSSLTLNKHKRKCAHGLCVCGGKKSVGIYLHLESLRFKKFTEKHSHMRRHTETEQICIENVLHNWFKHINRENKYHFAKQTHINRHHWPRRFHILFRMIYAIQLQVCSIFGDVAAPAPAAATTTITTERNAIDSSSAQQPFSTHRSLQLSLSIPSRVYQSIYLIFGW